MNCPKCGCEMENGFLQTSRMSASITWVPELRPLGLGSLNWSAQTVSDDLGIGNNAISSCICKQCKMIVSDYSGKK